MRRENVVIALAIILAFVNTAHPDYYSRALIVLPGAEQVDFKSAGARQQMIFYRVDPFPASDSIKHVHSALSDEGWALLEDSFLTVGRNPSIEPKLSDSSVSGKLLASWSAQKRSDGYRYSLLLFYESEQHEVVLYEYRYTDDYDRAYHRIGGLEMPDVLNRPPKTNRLRVQAVYFSADYVSQLRETHRRTQKDGEKRD